MRNGLQEIAALAGARPPVPGASGTVSLAITRRPRDAMSATTGAIATGVPGDGGVGGVADADLALTIASADAERSLSGEVEPSVAFMRGRLKATGGGALLLGLLASTATDSYRGTGASGCRAGRSRQPPGGVVAWRHGVPACSERCRATRLTGGAPRTGPGGPHAGGPG